MLVNWKNNDLLNAETGSTYTTVLLNSFVSGNGIGMESEHRVMKKYEQAIFLKEGVANIDYALAVIVEAAVARKIYDTPSMACIWSYSSAYFLAQMVDQHLFQPAQAMLLK